MSLGWAILITAGAAAAAVITATPLLIQFLDNPFRRPFTDPSAPSSPFVMPQYRVAAATQSERLEAQAAAASEEAKDDIQRADNYVLAVVLFAACLFLGGLSLRLRSDSARIAILGCGYVVFVAATIWIATSPVSVSV